MQETGGEHLLLFCRGLELIWHIRLLPQGHPVTTPGSRRNEIQFEFSTQVSITRMENYQI